MTYLLFSAPRPSRSRERGGTPDEEPFHGRRRGSGGWGLAPVAGQAVKAYDVIGHRRGAPRKRWEVKLCGKSSSIPVRTVTGSQSARACRDASARERRGKRRLPTSRRPSEATSPYCRKM